MAIRSLPRGMKKRLREGAKLIVIDPRRTDIVRSPHIEAIFHLPLQPGTNVAVLNADRARASLPKGCKRGLHRASAATWSEFARLGERSSPSP